MVGLYSSEALFEVGDDIVDVLRADGKADGRRRDALIEQLFLGELCVRRGRRMDDEGLHVRDVCTLASRGKISRWSMKRKAASCPPLISKVKMLAPPFGKYRS